MAIAHQPSQGVGQDGLGPLEQLVVQYAAQMTLQIAVDEDLFRALQAHLNSTQLVELTTVIAAYNMVARILLTLQITPEV